ncbi:MAG: hypothetical protein COV67_00650 [Nitrospinae bacterium CG11_big_fil_rev_8_21_14_0_20_56_8]|nr:MAG: hypothetical protein COV67_00650 [Nitrospinae bacterium CG11_big_fil_rev_8_21_14_0_20_56_8]
MKRIFKEVIRGNRWGQRGIAALMGVVFAIVLLAAIMTSFLVESQQKHSGSSLTYTSSNAMFAAEAGLRFASKCLLNPTSCTACSTWPGGDCSDWTNPSPFNPIPFGDSRGSFTISFKTAASGCTVCDADNIQAVSTATFSGSTRELSQIVSKATTQVCQLNTNAITACTGITFTNNADTDPPNAPTENGVCDLPAVPTITFPGNPSGCPNAGYPAMTAPVTVNGTEKTYCSWTQTSNFTVDATGVPGNSVSNPQLIYIKNNFFISGNDVLTLKGHFKFLVGGNFTMSNNSKIILGTATPAQSTLTVIVRGNFLQEGNTKFNPGNPTPPQSDPKLPWTTDAPGNPANLLVMVAGTGNLKNNITFHGVIYGPQMILDLENNADFLGSIVAQSVSMQNNSELQFNNTAAENTASYEETCTGGGIVQPPDMVE